MLKLSDLNVCFLAGTLGQGGSERQLFYMVETLLRHGARVRILSLTKGEFWEERLVGIGAPVVWVGEAPSRLARMRNIIAEVRRDPPDLVQSQHFYTNLYAAVAARLAGSREIGAVRSDVFSEVDSHAMLGKASLKIPRLLAANSAQAVKNASRYGLLESQLHLLPNVVNADDFNLKRRGSRPVIKLLAAGRLSQEKRLDRFLALLRRVRELTASDVRGVIAGDGPLRQSLERQAAEMGFSPAQLEFRGETHSMAPLYEEADLLVLTSEFEGTPNVILEAMASGLPVVATGVGGVPEIVEQNKTGFIIQPYDEGQMSAMILELVSSLEIRIAFGLAARKMIEFKYSLNHLPRYLNDLYSAALA
jgi:glycosyltransferase involved in cell wall biosynthesis